jgi:hypothetical protein
MNEDFISYIWKYKLFSREALRTFDGKALEIIDTGQHNRNSGPDFFAAKIKISGIIWVGNVEIHIKTSDWLKHHHENDKAYDNVILHVVYENDMELKRNDGSVIHALELKNKFDEQLWWRYEQLISNRHRIPCEKQLSKVDSFIVESWLNRLAVERLEDKANLVTHRLIQNKYHWDNTFYEFLARSFGFKINELPFEILAKNTPQQLFSKHKNNHIQIEALLFGQAGMLDKDFNDEYPGLLKKEYLFLKNKYRLRSIDKHLWKFSRIRPQNFPTIRLAQFATLVHQSNHLFSKILEERDKNELKEFFDVTVSPYWENHYVFDKPASHSSKRMGEDSVYHLLINTLCVFLFLYGKYKKEETFVYKSLSLLEHIPPENNSVIKEFNKWNIKAGSALHSQGLLQLKNEYCERKNCLNCGIGIKILNREEK